MRFDTIKISAFLVYMIQGKRPHMQVIDDGGDILHVKMATGDEIMIYLIENDIAAYEIINILNANSARKIYSLFILWCDLLLPSDGMYYIPDDWMAVLLSAHQDKIYAFDAFGSDVYVFPIYFEGGGVARDIRHGDSINANGLNTKRVKSRTQGEFWYVANFEVPLAGVNPLQVYWDILGINASTDRELIKRAYRSMARKEHPDTNTNDDATKKMQQLNEAYAKILAHLDEQKK